MTVVNVMPMTKQHIAALMPYEQAMFGPEAWTADGYRRELADKRHRYYIAAVGEDDALLGWAGVRVAADSAEILTVGVVPHARGQGIGARLVEMLLDEARRRGAVEAFLEVRLDNLVAQRLYERVQFQPVGIRQGYYDAGRVDAVVMRRAL
jgi:ribosomal-protein-alanine N-acetyltransferase